MKGFSKADWIDLEDQHRYHPGDVFPHDGREISPERIAELTSTQNKAGFAVIRVVETPAEPEHIQQVEQPKKATRSRRKAT